MTTMTVPFTDRLVASLKPRDGQRTVYWEPSRHGVGALGVRVSESTKTFVYMYWKDGKAKMMTVGRYPAMSLAEAHKAAGDAMLDRERGGDPAEKQVVENERKKVATTVSGLATEYLDKWAKPRKKSWKEDERILNHDVLPVLGKRRIEDVRRREIVHLLDGIVGRGSPIAANRCLAVVRKMFNFAVARDLIEHSPCTQIEAPALAGQRERVLTTDELKTFLEKLPDLPLWPPTVMAFLMELLTAQRCGEVIGALWSEIQEEQAIWTIPSSKAKNKHAHRVPLTAPVLRLLKAAKRIDSGKNAVFPSRQDGEAMVETALGRALNRHNAKLAEKPFTPHDLRRTAATHMTSIGVPRLVVSKVLNHVETGVTAVYDRHGYDAEKREALEKWAAHLATLGLEAALVKVEAKVRWQTEGKWWDKRVARLAAHSS